jgi:hypothetical protein
MNDTMAGMRKLQLQTLKLTVMKARLQRAQAKRRAEGTYLAKARPMGKAPDGTYWCDNCQEYHPLDQRAQVEAAIGELLSGVPGVKDVQVLRAEDLTDEQAKAIGINKPAKPTLN